MRRKLPYVSSSLYVLLLSFTLFSCVTSKKFREDVTASRDKDKKSFVQTADGNTIEANDAVLRSPLFGKSTIELDNTTRIPTKEIVAYQNNSGYYRKIRGQFAPRVKKGSINMYIITETYQTYDGATAHGGGGWH